jgi:hypothetical protein
MPTYEASVEPESSNDTSTTAGRSMSGTLLRKVAKRTFPWLPAAAEPLASSTPIDGDGDIRVPVAKKPRLEVPLLETAAQAVNIASLDAEEAVLPPADADPMTAASHPMNSDSEQTSRDEGLQISIPRIYRPRNRRQTCRGGSMRACRQPTPRVQAYGRR